jgi:hypothetical protein
VRTCGCGGGGGGLLYQPHHVIDTVTSILRIIIIHIQIPFDVA